MNENHHIVQEPTRKLFILEFLPIFLNIFILIAWISRWVPCKPDQIIEVSEEIVSNYKKVYPLMGDDLDKNGSFSVITDIKSHETFEENSSSCSSETASCNESRTSSPTLESPPGRYLEFYFLF